MNLLLLPGKNPKSGEWLVEVERSLAPLFDRTQRYNLDFWQSGEELIHLRTEEAKLAREAQDFSPYCVFAKSAGSALACLAIADGVLRPEACLFTGFPLSVIRQFKLPVGRWLETCDVPVIIVQNSDDPFGTYDEVYKFFTDIGRPSIEVRRFDGVRHDYTDFEALRDLARELLNRPPGEAHA